MVNSRPNMPPSSEGEGEVSDWDIPLRFEDGGLGDFCSHIKYNATKFMRLPLAYAILLIKSIAK